MRSQAYLPLRATLLAGHAAGPVDSQALFLSRRARRLGDREGAPQVDGVSLSLASVASHPMPCATVSPRTSWAKAPIFAPSRSCSAMPACAPTQRYAQVDIDHLMAVYDRSHPRAPAENAVTRGSNGDGRIRHSSASLGAMRPRFRWNPQRFPKPSRDGARPAKPAGSHATIPLHDGLGRAPQR